MSAPYGPKIRLAAFEAAIVESGIRNLNYGRCGVPRRVPAAVDVGEWGTKEQTHGSRPRHRACSCRPPGAWTAGRAPGELAADVQRPREDLRYKYAAVEGQARSLIEAHC